MQFYARAFQHIHTCAFAHKFTHIAEEIKQTEIALKRERKKNRETEKGKEKR